MSSPASIAKHPIHPMLVSFPIGLWIFSLASDIIYRARWGPAVWSDVAFYTLAGGIIGALLAAVPGLIDLISATGRAKAIGIYHMCINLIAVVLFAIDFWLRTSLPPRDPAPFVLSVIGVVLVLISGWLGGSMVFVHGMALEPRPHPGGERETETP